MKPLVLWLRASGQRQTTTVEVRGLGMRETMPAVLVDRPDGTGDFLFMHFHDAVRLAVAGVMQDCAPHSFVVWEPGAPHLFGQTHRRWTHSWVHCSGNAVAESFAASGLEANQPVPLPDASLVSRYLPAIYQEIRNHSEPDPVVLDHLFGLWLREVDRARDRAGGSSPIPANLLAVRRFIESHLSQRIRLDDLAAQALMSVSRLSAQFKRYFHASPMDYVLRLRLRRASHLLLDRNLTMSQVARQVGFSDPYYFSRQFKIHYGLSPSLYRRDAHDRSS